MDKVKALFTLLAAPLEWCAGIVGKFPKAALIAWAISLAVVAWLS